MENDTRLGGGGIDLDPILPPDEPSVPELNGLIAVPKTLLTDIGKAIGDKTGNKVPIRVQDMASEIGKISGGGSSDSPFVIHNHMVDGVWVRPSEYEDMSAIEIDYDNDQVLWLSYYKWVPEWWYSSMLIYQGGTVEVGHIENGEFVPYYTHSVPKNKNTAIPLPENWMTAVVKVTNTGGILEIKFADITTAQSGLAKAISSYQNCCVEIHGSLPRCTKFIGLTGVFVENYTATFATNPLASVSSLSSMWSRCVSLQKLDLSHWKTSHWSVTSLASAWYNCGSLQEIDLTGLDVSEWPVTSLRQTFSGCRSLKTLLLNKEDTSSWSVSDVYGIFDNCLNLLSYDDLFDTSNWTLTSADGFIVPYGCMREVNFTCPPNGNLYYNSYEDYTLESLKLNNISPNANLVLNYLPGLSKSNLLEIIDNLPEAVGSRTFSISYSKNRLTLDELAIATQKGWTVS